MVTVRDCYNVCLSTYLVRDVTGLDGVCLKMTRYENHEDLPAHTSIATETKAGCATQVPS